MLILTIKVDIYGFITGIICSLVASCIIWLFKVVISKNSYREIRKALSGIWIGEAQVHHDHPHDRKYSSEFFIKTFGKKIYGKINVKSSSGHKWLLNFNGEIISGKFLKLDYKTKEPKVLQFGTIIFELSSNAKKLNGFQVCYGREREKLITSKISISKQEV